MTFTYDLSATGDDLTVSQIRLIIGDTDETTDKGIKPDGTNYTDAEILYYYGLHSNVKLAAADLLENLAALWAGAGESVRIRDYSINTSGKADSYRAQAAQLRAQSRTGVVTLTREDAYS